MKKIDTFKERTNISSTDLKKYADYLITEYKKINDKYEDSGVYWDLYEFYNEGKIKDLISKNDKINMKINILENYRYDISSFAKDFNIPIYLYTFEDFLGYNFPKKYANYLMYKDAKKYNL